MNHIRTIIFRPRTYGHRTSTGTGHPPPSLEIGRGGRFDSGYLAGWWDLWATSVG